MSKKTWPLTKGARYRATLTLGYFESYAGNSTIASRFADGGFIDVTVTGSDKVRTIQGTWNKDDQTIPLDAHISDVQVIPPVV